MTPPISAGNGVMPITMTPPQNVAPTTAGYGTSFGAYEKLPSMTATIPDEIPSTFNSTYRFEEYYLTVVSGDIVRNSINGQTIDWSASELDQDGTLVADYGVERPYSLVGKSYLGHQYTFLEFNAILVEGSTDKPISWVVRMKHS